MANPNEVNKLEIIPRLPTTRQKDSRQVAFLILKSVPWSPLRKSEQHTAKSFEKEFEDFLYIAEECYIPTTKQKNQNDQMFA